MDPIEIKVTGTDDSEGALKGAEKNVKALGEAADDAAPKIKGTGDAAKDAEPAIKGMGDSAAQAGPKIKGMGDGLDGLDDKVRKSSHSSDEAATRLDKLGESADVGESRFIGLASGIDGATSLMDDPSPQEMAQGIADLSDGIAKAGVPWMIKMRDATSSFIGSIGGIKGALVGGGAIAALGGLAYAIGQANEAAHEAKFDDLTKQLQETGDVAEAAQAALGDPGPNSTTNMFSKVVPDVEGLQDVLKRLIDDGQFETAKDLIAEAGARGDITAGQMEALTGMIDHLANSSEGAALTQKNLADSIRGTNDAIQASTDPVFAMIDADNQLRDANQAVADAQNAVNEAIKEHGEGSPEHIEALQNLRDAELDVASSAYDNEAAMRELAASMVEGGGDVTAMTDHLRSLENQGLVAKGTTEAFGRAVRNLPRRANTTITATDYATTVLRATGDLARALDGTITNITLQASLVGGGAAYLAATGGRRTRAAGGPGGAAVGGPRRDMTLVGEDGPELIDLPPGTMVRPAANTAYDMAAGGWAGGATITWAGGPSDDLGMAVWRWLQQRVQVSYGGDVQRALGG